MHTLDRWSDGFWWQ